MKKKYKTEEEEKRARYEWNKKWRIKNLEKVRKIQRNAYQRRKEQNNLWTKNNPEKAKANSLKWQKNNPEKAYASNLKWRKKNPKKVKQYAIKWQEKNPEKVKASVKKWQKNNPEKVYASNLKWRKKNPEKASQWQKKNPELYKKRQKVYFTTLYKKFNSGDRMQLWKRKIRIAKQGTKVRFKNKRSIDITPEFLEQKFLEQDKKCPYLGVELYYRDDVLDSGLGPSIDRIDSTKGYLKDNTEIVSYLANTVKGQMTKELFLEFCEAVINKNFNNLFLNKIHKSTIKNRKKII